MPKHGANVNLIPVKKDVYRCEKREGCMLCSSGTTDSELHSQTDTQPADTALEVRQRLEAEHALLVK